MAKHAPADMLAPQTAPTLSLPEIQDLISFIATSGLEEVELETESLKLSVKRSAPVQIQQMAAQPYPAQALQVPAQHNNAMVAQQLAAQTSPAQAQQLAPVADAAPALATGNIQRAPMIGTFYTASSPDTPVFVKVGDRIEKGQTICIIEAMKLFNEIEADFTGVVTKVLVNNATPVEYDQPLFEIA
jgi:acetyl-CoA carboxylase biotin carboxyl carrier protein